MCYSSPLGLNLSGNSIYWATLGCRAVWQGWKPFGACSGDPDRLQPPPMHLPTGRPGRLAAEKLMGWNAPKPSCQQVSLHKKMKGRARKHFKAFRKTRDLTKSPEVWKKLRVKRIVLYHRSFVKDDRHLPFQKSEPSKTFRKFKYDHNVQNHWDGRGWRTVRWQQPRRVESLLQKNLNLCLAAVLRRAGCGGGGTA